MFNCSSCGANYYRIHECSGYSVVKSAPEYNPIATIERIAAEIHDFFPSAAVGLLAAATALESERSGPVRAFADHWAEHNA